MKHLGDITKIKGSEVPLTEIVVGGSPCQDLSVAGKRKGLAGERSGLFMEQIRIIKEMRNESYKKLSMQGAVDPSRIIPRFMVWENVPGAFSSNNGEDFRAVLEETAKVKDKDAVIPRLEGKQKWSPSGCIMGDGWSIAWRVHDAQFWGVPQRRKRIALVADFTGGAAPEILFERQGLSGNTEESQDKGQTVAGNTLQNSDEASRVISFQERAGCDGGVKESSSNMIESEHCQPSTINQYCLNDQGGQQISVSENVSGTLRAEEHGHQPLVFEPGAASRVGGHVYDDGKAGTVRANAGDNQQAVVYGISAYESNAMKSSNPNSGIYKADTTRTLDNNGGNPACNQGGMIVLEGNGSRPSHKGDGYSESDVSYTLNATEHHAVCTNLGGAEPYTASKASFFCKSRCDGKAETLVATDYKDPQIVCYGLDRASFNQGQNAKYSFSVQQDLAQTIVAKGPGGVLTER